MTDSLYDYAMKRGDSLTLLIWVTQADEPAEPTDEITYSPVDLTGATIWMTAKKKKNDADDKAVFQISSPADITINVDPLTGKAKIVVPASATEANVALVYNDSTTRITLYYDIQVKTADDNVSTVQEGRLHVDIDITQTSA